MTTNASRHSRMHLIFGFAWNFLAVVAFWAAAAAPAFTQTSIWTGGAGNWDPCPQQGGNALWNTCPTWPDSNTAIAIIEGGPVTIADGEFVNSLQVTSPNSLVITPGYLGIYGSSIANSGTISIGPGNGLLIEPGVTTTLTGSGTINITSPNAGFTGTVNGPSAIINQTTIQGEGNLGAELLTITNQGLISATTGTLNVYPVAMTNTGTIQAQSGATLDLIGAITYNNSGGTIQALNNSTVLLQTNISGGTLTTAGSGVFTLAPPSGVGITTLTNAGTFNIPSGASLNWTGTITNTGVFQLSGSIWTNGTVTLQGSGTVPMSGGEFESNSGSALINQQLIHGGGEFFEVPLTNQATIQADNPSSTLYIVDGTTTNAATLEATGGGTLDIESVVNNSGGTIEAQSGSTVIIGGNFSGSISGGTLTTSGTGVIESQNGVLDGTVNIPTNAGTLDVTSGYDLYFQGTINNSGTINVTDNSCIVMNEASILTGSGILTMGPNACFYGSGIPFTNESTIEGAGSIGDSNPMPITNGASGTIIANLSGGTLTIQPNSTGFTNTGTLIANAGSTLNVSGSLTNLKKGVLTGGTYSASGTIDLQASITTNNANITLNGAGAQIYDAFDQVNALAGLTTNGKGTLTLQNGASLATMTDLSNKGTITIGAGSSLTTSGTFTETAKTVTVDGTLTAPSGLTLTKGTLQGQGTLAAVVNSSAILTVGDSTSKAGTLTVAGSYTQNAAGTLDIAINGAEVGTQYSQLAVSNGASLSGTLSIKLNKKFVPAIGTNFTILTASAISGQFSTVKGLSIDSGEHFEINYDSGSVTLTVVSGPYP